MLCSSFVSRCNVQCISREKSICTATPQRHVKCSKWVTSRETRARVYVDLSAHFLYAAAQCIIRPAWLHKQLCATHWRSVNITVSNNRADFDTALLCEFWRPVHALTARVELDMHTSLCGLTSSRRWIQVRGAIGNSKGKVSPTTGHEGGGGGYVVAQLVEALSYKPAYRGFDSRWNHWDFRLTQYFRPHCGPGIDSAYK
jgi:hypothetical protein